MLRNTKRNSPLVLIDGRVLEIAKHSPRQLDLYNLVLITQDVSYKRTMVKDHDIHDEYKISQLDERHDPGPLLFWKGSKIHDSIRLDVIFESSGVSDVMQTKQSDAWKDVEMTPLKSGDDIEQPVKPSVVVKVKIEVVCHRSRRWPPLLAKYKPLTSGSG